MGDIPASYVSIVRLPEGIVFFWLAAHGTFGTCLGFRCHPGQASSIHGW